MPAEGLAPDTAAVTSQTALGIWHYHTLHLRTRDLKGSNSLLKDTLLGAAEMKECQQPLVKILFLNIKLFLCLYFV